MTKPRITASMLRKRPKPAEPAPQQQAAADIESEDFPAAQHAQPDPMIDNPSFRAPQFGIKPRAATQAPVRVQHAPKRRFEGGRA